MKRLISAVILCLPLVSCGPQQDGHGTYEYDDGSKYIGEWKDGKRHGQGTWTQPGRGEYVGPWKNGSENGQGTFTYTDGGQYVGEFKDGNSWKGEVYDKDGNVIATY